MREVKSVFYNKKFIVIILAFFVLLGIQFQMTIADSFRQLEGYKTWTASNVNKLLSVSVMNKKQVTEILYNEFIDAKTSQQLLEVIEGDEAVKDEVRSEFLSRYLPLYNNIKRMGMSQFQFHLPNTESFLRLQNPELYGDRLISVRQTVNEAINSRQLVMGFEEGKMNGGYRYVYPILNGDQLVGTVELSFSYYSVVKPVLSTYGLQALFLMSRDEIEFKTLEFNKTNYVQDQYFDLGYLDQNFAIENLNGCLGISEDVYSRLNKKVKQSLIQKRYGADGFVSIVANQECIWAMPIAVEDYTGKVVGHLIFYKNDPQMYDLYVYQKRQRISMYVTSLIIILLLVPCVVLFVRVKVKATSDSLTNLCNRHYYNEHIVNKGIKGSVMMIDIDDFKLVNDQYGHGTGDLILKEIADILKDNIRKSDTAIRWGGEEFLIILQDADVNVALKKGEYILELIRGLRVEDIAVTVSIGVTRLEENYDESIKKADAALYYVKSHGKNAVKLFEDEL